MRLAPRTKAFQDLYAAIAALTPYVDARAAATLADMATLIAQLDQPSEGILGCPPERLRHLLALAGPDIAPMLLQQLVQDLTQCRDDIAAAVDNDDWQAGRNGSHVLISLAGSVGAVSLQGLAEGMNAAAHRQDKAEAMRLLPQIMAELTTLVRVIAATPPVETAQGDDA